MGAFCPAPSSLYFFNLRLIVGFARSCPRVCLAPPLALTSPTLSKPLYLRSPSNHKQSSSDVPDRSFDSFNSANSYPGGDSDRKGKKQRWISTNVGNEGSDFSSGQESDNERIEMQATREEEEEKYDSYSTEAPKAASQGRSLWEFFKLRREKALQPLIEKGSGLDGEKMEMQWSEILDPTPENLLALLLTGLLGLTVLRIFWQLLLVAVTIVLAAFKYSVIAAILLALLVVFL